MECSAINCLHLKCSKDELNLCLEHDGMFHSWGQAICGFEEHQRQTTRQKNEAQQH